MNNESVSGDYDFNDESVSGNYNYFGNFLNPDNFLSNDAFLTSIGIDPSSTYKFANSSSPSNSQIQADINANPALVDYFNKLLGTNFSSSGLSQLAVGAGGLAGLMGAVSGKTTPTGYQGKIPNLVANRQMVTAPISSAVVDGKTVPIRPGAGGTKYGGDVVYTNAQQPVIQAAKGKYLRGPTDGMADELPAQIGKNQPAALSHGEFVVPADVVSHLGNGNSDAGAKKLYQMMDKVRQARTGNKKQGKKINPDKYMPGGSVGMASGGEVKHFQTGGTTAPTSAALAAGLTGQESNLSNWVGPYVTDMLGKGQALSNMPYEQYSGQLTAGASPLQSQAFTTAGGLASPTSIGNAATTAGGIATKAQGLAYQPTTTSFDTTQANTYMNPYLQASLNPQLEEARRQSQITQQQNAAKMTQAGAFGGSRQAILDAETQRSLGSNLANITGQGYNTAYDKAMAQFNAEQARKMQENQFGAGFGLQGLQTGLQAAQAQGALGTAQNQADLANLTAQLGAGTAQRGIESEGIAADKTAFEEARTNPFKMVQFQQSLLQGLPLAAQSYNTSTPSALVSGAQGATTIAGLLKNLGIT
jgi:hypothetical protein